MATDTTRPYRVTVRGQFDRLTDELHRQLLADADAHDTVTSGRFSEDGTVTYQRDLVGFTFRCIVHAAGPAGEEDAATEGELRAIEWLERAGWPYKRLSTVAAPVPEPRAALRHLRRIGHRTRPAAGWEGHLPMNAT